MTASANDTEPARPIGLIASIALRLFALLLLIIGVVLAAGGLWLIGLGGSIYYAVCGIAVATSAILLWRRRALGATIYGWMLLGTLAWALWEVGFDGWALAARLIAPFVLGLVLLIPAIRRSLLRARPGWSVTLKAVATGAALIAGAGLHAVVGPDRPADPIYRTGVATAAAKILSPVTAPDDRWTSFGNDGAATRFSAADVINTGNVGRLEVAWTASLEPSFYGLESTPLKIGDRLFTCNNRNDIFAIDAETGRLAWRYKAEPDLSNVPHPVCRGVSYYSAPGARGECASRILMGTVDGRLIAVDEATGRPCAGFGVNGQVSLLTGLGDMPKGYYGLSSPPVIVRGVAVVGGVVPDDQFRGEPSGVIRAYDAMTGKLAWAWDMGRPDLTGEPGPGETYTPSTPNSWGPGTADEELGLVYVPLGNPSPDPYGVQRSAAEERFGTSLVAIDAATGKLRWSFQTVHHDLWDFDNPSGPTLIDLPRGGQTMKALILPTKTGELFVLDRATGRPVFPVREIRVPQRGALPEERISPTQPSSFALPAFRGADITERRTWGITPLDHLWCRIKFRESRYEGPYTPPGLTPSIALPGYAGGMEWGGVSVDLDRHLLIVNSNIVPNRWRLFPRSEAQRRGMRRATVEDPRTEDYGLRGPMEGTPYAVEKSGFFSPLQLPCTQPPYGRISAVDLASGRLVWTRALGTAAQSGPFNIASLLPFTVGTFNLGGTVVTRGGLTFISSAQDRRVRAMDTVTGRELWSAPLPAAGTANPMTYRSRSGRQFLIVSAGGAMGVERAPKAQLIAFALPDRGRQ